LETFLEPLLWNIFQCLHHISLDVTIFLKSSSLQSTLIFGKSGKSLGVKSGKGWVFHFGNRFLGTKCLTAPCELEHWSWWRIQSLGQSSAFSYAQLHVIVLIFPHNKLGRLFVLVLWIQSEQYPWYLRKRWAISSLVISTCELSWIVGMSAVPLQTSGSYWKLHVSVFASWLERSNTHHHAGHSLCDETYKHRLLIKLHTLLALMRWNHNWCKLKHAQTWL